MSLYQSGKADEHMIRIVTDTASDITVEQAADMNIDLVPLDITFEDGPCPQNTESDFALFYQRLEKCENLPITSRPSPEAYLKIFEEAKAAGDEVLVLTLSSGLSGTCESALMAQKMANYNGVYVVDTHQAILTQRILVEHAFKMRDEGYGAREIADKITALRDKVVVCGVVDTLKYLQKGGRIPASLARIGTFLHIKPVIVLEDKILKTLGKARGREAGIAMLFKRMEQDGFNRAYPCYVGYTSNRVLVEKFQQQLIDRYGSLTTRMHPIGGIIGTHCGTDCIAVAYVKGE